MKETEKRIDELLNDGRQKEAGEMVFFSILRNVTGRW